MGQIIGSAAKPKRCNLSKLSQLGTPAAGEHILVSSGNSMNAAGQGNFDCYIEGDNTHLATELELRPINPETLDVQIRNTDNIFGIIGVADGSIHPSSSASAQIYTEAVPISKETPFVIKNPQQLSLQWIRVFYYMDGVFVRYAHIRNSPTSLSEYSFTATPDGTYNQVRFNVSKESAFASLDDVTFQYTKATTIREELAEVSDSIVTEEEVEEIAETAASGVFGEIKHAVNTTGVFTSPTFTKGYLLNDSGELSTSTNMATTDFLPTYGSATLKVADIKNILNVNYLSYAFYDENKIFISGEKTYKDAYEVSIPGTAKYVRLCTYSPSDPEGSYSVNALERIDAIIQSIDDLSSALSDGELATLDDVLPNDYFAMSNGSLYLKRPSGVSKQAVLFKDDVMVVEFTLNRLWDSNLISLAFGRGIDGSDVECFAGAYLGTSSRPNDFGSIGNHLSSTAQNASLYGTGRFSGDYRQPQIKPATVAVGNRCRIELIDGFFRGSIYNTSTGLWDWWFVLDTSGTWTIPDRYGWNLSKNIGLACLFFTSDTENLIASDVRILARKNTPSEKLWLSKNNYPSKRQWVAIGDSITAINENNGLSYVGYAKRALGWSCTNQGHGGWTIYKLWRDRETAGWETDISALGDNDVVTILAGTNDFDTKSFSTPASDTAMDAAANPHPRFGTTDPTSEDAKDPHTTLGCLRLMIERILELKPSARLIVFSPFYREKGSLNGSTGWNKDLYINSDGKTIYDYADAIYSVAREYNLPAYNTCRDCGINVQTLATYTYDDLHIGQMGGQLIGEYVAKRIRP